MMNLGKAIAIAAAAHEGQVDKAGAPYITHPLRVMLAMNTDAERIVAVLHDVIEDTAVTLEDLRAAGLTAECEAALLAVTRKPDETYEEFIDRAALDPIGRAVKIADLADNMNLARISNPTARDYERIERYKTAHKKLED